MRYLLIKVILVCFMSLTACKKEEQQSTELYEVEVLPINLVPTAKTLEFEGQMVSASKHQLSFLVDGKILRLDVRKGDMVKKGQILGSIEDTDYTEALKIAKAKLDEAEDQYSRLSRMYASGSLPEADFKKVELLREQARANYNLYTNKKAYTRLQAPINGVVNTIYSRVGSTVSAGQPVLELINDEVFYAKVGVPEAYIAKIKVGDSCQVNIPALGEAFSSATVYQLSPVPTAISRNYPVELALNSLPEGLREGMLCQIKITLKDQQNEALFIPLSQVKTDAEGLQFVFVSRDDKAYKQRISTGGIQSNTIEVLKGLAQGDQLIINPPRALADGSSIKIK